MPAGLGPVAAVAAGNVHACAVQAEGALVCFGHNTTGQCDVPYQKNRFAGVTF